jgi:hypothetical protein
MVDPVGMTACVIESIIFGRPIIFLSVFVIGFNIPFCSRASRHIGAGTDFRRGRVA